MFARFFINHPVMANVIAIITIILGVLALYRLPVEQYPQITPPTIQVTAVYPGANAQVVADTVAAPIEQQVNGVEGMLYMQSTSSSDGSYNLTITFQIGTNLDMAQVLVQNRVSLALPQLPEDVRRIGVQVKKRTTDILLVVSLSSPHGSYDALFLHNFAVLRLQDELSRVPGVGEVRISGGSPFAMRLWLDPQKLQARDLTVSDVLRALREQNVQVAPGQLGQPPQPSDQNFQFTLTSLGRLSDPEQFARIVLKSGSDGQLTLLGDVGRVALAGQSYDTFAERNGKEAVSVLVYQLPGANALEVAERVRQAMRQLSRSFPPDLEYEIPFDTTRFVSRAVHEVYRTLIEAGVLVLLVILVFLQDWRAVLVPATTVPVTIVGAFAIMWAMGFSANLLTLFGLVLAIGIVVDDAIVIVENAARHIEHGLPPKAAAIRAMDEMTGPVISITLVLMAVFLPASFLGGITGQLYRQFALTIAATALLSAINALTLKPVQCAAWLRPVSNKRSWFVRTFDRFYASIEWGYTWILQRVAHRRAIISTLFAGLLVVTAWGFWKWPTAFMPNEDQGYMFVSVMLPDAASQSRTRQVMRQLEDAFQRIEGVDNWLVLGGLSLLDGSTAPNAATLIIVTKDWDERARTGATQERILEEVRRVGAQVRSAVLYPFLPPAIRGIGVSGGFQLMVQDRSGVGLLVLGQKTQELLDQARQQPQLTALNTTYRPGVPQYYLEINREKAKMLGLSLDDVFTTLQGNLGWIYIDDFNKFGRTYQVLVQADYPFRLRPEDIVQLQVRNRDGEMVPLGSFVEVVPSYGPHVIMRYNLYPAAMVTGQAAPGVSTSEALARVEQLADQVLPDTMGYEWTGMAYQEKLLGNQAIWALTLAVGLVYLVLAAQYNSWLLPFAVILVVPLGVLGSLVALWWRNMPNDIYAQVGAVLIVALASKNAILVVEFARELRLQGKSLTEAAVEAARLRLRPILMTSLAFILGVVPLVWANGVGAASQRSLGTAVFGGMIAATVLAVFFVPTFFLIFQALSEWFGRRREKEQELMLQIDGQLSPAEPAHPVVAR